MPTTYRIYGNSDPSSEGFETPDEIKAYIAGGIFKESQGRYRYSQRFFADRIILSHKGRAYGHFDIDHPEEPTDEDRRKYSKTKQVFVVTKSTLYEKPVQLYRKTGSPDAERFKYKVGHPGLEIFEDDFNKILADAGTLQPFWPNDEAGSIERRYCRICYNSNGWRKPDGSAGEVTASYYAQHGFGHEEWLFNYEWCIDGYKYGFLQPFTKRLANYQGKTFSIILYTKKGGHRLLAGTISKVYVPHDDELASAFGQIEANGWFEQMREDVLALRDTNVDALAGNEPGLIINVRFRPEDVVLYEPMPEFPAGSKPTTTDRYELLLGDDGELPSIKHSPTPKKRSELQYLRAAQKGTPVDPAHTRLQNKLYDWLCEMHGPDAVRLELEWVDLQLTEGGTVTFFEIKTDSSAKRCIRNALGQLFEYSTYATESKAHKWMIVGDPTPTQDDADYLKHLRSLYNIPLFYAQFDWKTGSLRPPI